MVIYLKVKPNQRFNRVEKAGTDWQIRLKEQASDGKANEALLDFLSEILEISKTRISLKKGKASRYKCLEIESDEKSVYEKLQLSINKTM